MDDKNLCFDCSAKGECSHAGNPTTCFVRFFMIAEGHGPDRTVVAFSCAEEIEAWIAEHPDHGSFHIYEYAGTLTPEDQTVVQSPNMSPFSGNA